MVIVIVANGYRYSNIKYFTPLNIFVSSKSVIFVNVNDKENK